MAALREILASYGIEFDKERQLEKGSAQVDGLAGKLVGFGKLVVGAFAVDALVGFGRELLQEADALAKLSGALQVSAAELQGWQHAAALSGSSAQEFNNAFTKFTRNVAEAADEATGPAAEAFKNLGIEIKDAAGEARKPIELLDSVADALAGMQDPAKRTSAVMDLFGRAGAKLLPLFDEGSEGIAKLRKEVEELGFGFDDAFLDGAQEVNDNLDRLKMGIKGVAIQAIGPLLPELVELSKSMVAGAKVFVRWVKETGILRLAFGNMKEKGLALLIAVVPKLIGMLGGLRGAFVALGRVVMKQLLPFLLLEDIIVFLAGGKSAIGKNLDRMFGAGTADKSRDAILKLGEALGQFTKDIAGFLGVIEKGPDSERSEKAVLSLQQKVQAFGKSIESVFGKDIADAFLFFTDLATGSWSNFVKKFKAGASALPLAMRLAMEAVRSTVMITAGKVQDIFAGLWNAVLVQVHNLLLQIGAALASVPGGGEVAGKIAGSAIGLLGGLASTDSEQGARADAVNRAGQLQRDAEAAAAELDTRRGLLGYTPAGAPAGAVATAPMPPTSVVNQDVQQTNQITNNITVPPGTPTENARDVGKAATKGTRDGINTRALGAALGAG
jgi:hypothetical protein